MGYHWVDYFALALETIMHYFGFVNGLCHKVLPAAMIMAIGALVTMFALGMFWAKGARADHVTTNAAHLVSMTPSSLSVNAKSAWTVTLGISGAGLTA